MTNAAWPVVWALDAAELQAGDGADGALASKADTVGCNDFPVICRGGADKSRQRLTTDRMSRDDLPPTSRCR